MTFSMFGWYPFGGDPGSSGMADPSQDPSGMYNPSPWGAVGQGLTAAGAAMLMGGDPRYKQSFGAALGRGFAGFNQGLGQGMQDQRRNMLADQEINTGRASMGMKLDEINRHRGFLGQAPLSMQEFTSGKWGAPANPAGALQMGGGSPSVPSGVPAGGAGSQLAAAPQVGQSQPAAPQGGQQPQWRQYLDLSNRAMQYGLTDDAVAYRQAAEADPDYQAAKAAGLIPVEVAKATALVPSEIAKAAGIDRATLSGRMAVAQAGRTYVNTPTQIINNQENAAAKGIGEGIAKNYNEIQTQGLQSGGKAANWQRLGSLLGQIKTGKYAGTVNDLAKSMQSWGFDPASFGITNSTALVDAAASMSNQMALQLRNPAGGGGMPGSLSNSDRDFLTSATAGIETSQDAIPLMVEWQTKLARRDAEVARVAREYKNSTLPGKPAGVIDDGVYDAIQKFADSHPLFDAKDAAKVQALGGGHGAAPGASSDDALLKKYGVQ